MFALPSAHGPLGVGGLASNFILAPYIAVITKVLWICCLLSIVVIVGPLRPLAPCREAVRLIACPNACNETNGERARLVQTWTLRLLSISPLIVQLEGHLTQTLVQISTCHCAASETGEWLSPTK